MSMKKNKMVPLLLVLLALVVVYLGLSTYNKNAEERKAEEEKSQEISLAQVETLHSLSYTNGSIAMSFTCDEGNWYYDEDAEIPLNQKTLKNLENTVTGLKAIRKLEDPDELADYGLTDPLYTIQYTGDDSDEIYTILIGNATGEDYYVTIGDSEEVYTIDSTLVGTLAFDLADVVEYDTVPNIGSGNLKKVEVTENGTTTTYEEEDDLSELAGGFGTLSLTDCADYHVTEDKLSEYGLSESERIKAVATYTDSNSGEEETFTVYIGKTDEDGTNRYVMADGSKVVCRVTTEIVNNMITTD